MRFIDLSHTFRATMPSYPGDNVPLLQCVKNVPEHGFTQHWLASSMHVGTHLDAPWHFIADGARVDDVPLDRLAGRGVLIDARARAVIDDDALEQVTLARGDIVLVWTGYDAHFLAPEYFTQHPVLTENFAQKLVRAGVYAVGMDTPSPDRYPFVVHRLLLSNNVLIIENLTHLEQVAGIKNMMIYAFAPKFAAEGAFVRVVAQSND